MKATQPAMYPYSYSTTLPISAPVGEVFALVDDHTRLSSHMTRRSWAMGGGSMTIDTDASHGKTIGSRLRLHGVVFGVSLFVEEVVVERMPPFRKVWETVGEPKLLVIGRYRMGVELEEFGRSSRLRVFIDYDLPAKAPWRWLGALFGRYYARWCTARIANDAARHFGSDDARQSR